MPAHTLGMHAAHGTEVLKINPAAPAPAALERAAEVLRRGGLVAFPTETVYGLGAHALDATAVARIYTAKGRPATNPVIVHVADAATAHALAAAWPPMAERMAQAWWPGPLTMVLPRAACVPEIVAAGGGTVGLRMPNHPVALALLRTARLPVAAPSANRSSELSPTRAEHVLAVLAGRVDLILDGGPCSAGIESTVVDLTTTPPRVLRPGPINPADLERLLGPVTRPSRANLPALASAPLPSPGLLARHYAPRTPTICVEGSAAAQVHALAAQGRKVGWLILEFNAAAAAAGTIQVELPGNPAACASALYDALHKLDAAGLDCIVAELPPETDAWLAVRDRLLRAAAK